MTEGRLNTVAKNAAGEWDYQIHKSHVTGHEMDVSIPCQLRFESDPERDMGRFHAALREREYGPVATDPCRGDAPHYDGEVVNREHYTRIRVLVFRGGVVRLYPKDNFVPPASDLRNLLEAIEEGFDAQLVHDSIESGGDSDGE